ncbi:MAG: radical SAM protein [Bacteroidota bacterium]
MKKRLLLINPVNKSRLGVQSNPRSKYPPIAFGILKKLTPDNWDVKIIDENMDDFVYEEADLVGFTAYTSSITRAYKISQIYREKGIPTVIGGVHVSIMQDEALKYTDSVVVGDAEKVWEKILNDFENNKLQRKYFQPLTNLENIPVADHNIFNKRYMFGSIQTSRGCPNNCSFCVTPVLYKGKYLRRPVEEILSEIEYHPKQHLLFIDDNIMGYSELCKQEAFELVKGMVDKKLNKMWMGNATVDIAENTEYLKMASEAGCKLLFLGIEADDEDALKEMNKMVNLRLKVENYQNAIKKIHKQGIAVMAGLIFGLDSDNMQNIEERVSFIKKSDLDAVQMSILTPFPGTRVYTKYTEENRIFRNNFPDDWERYDGLELVYHPKSMDSREFEVQMNHNFKRVFNKTALFKRYLKSLTHLKKETAVWGYQSGKHFYKFLKPYFR